MAVFYPKLGFFSILVIFLAVFAMNLTTKPPSVNFSPPSLLPPKFSLKDLTKLSTQTTFLSVGDIMLGRYCNVQILKNKDWKYLFLKTASFIAGADIAFGNLEAPMLAKCPTTETGMVFCSRPESIEGLKLAGFDILSLANNHILNYGQDGLDQTKLLLTKNGILISDLSNLTIKQSNNISFGFLSFDLITYPNTLVIEKIKENSPKVDILIVSLHWGTEYQKQPTDQQKALARQIIDAGAKIIIGHHPHVTQPVEKYDSGLIFYSLGNFVFDQPWSEETKKGNIAKIIFEGKEIKSYELIPIYIENFCQPELVK